VRFTTLYGELITAIFRILTGRLFSEEQIKSITSHATGKYLAEFFPDVGEEAEARQRVDEAKEHILAASSIISKMQKDLDSKTENLDALLEEIEHKKSLAERYRELANTNKAKFSAIRQEMEDALRQQLVEQSEQGKGLRRFVSVLIGLVTLIAGAALGAYFKDIVAWFNVVQLFA